MSRLSRREFLAIGSGVTATGAALLSGCGGAKEVGRLYATLTPEEEMKLGRESWYATTCRECPAGCGLLVRIVDGRAKKIEGNPLHPLNRGSTCARAQAALQGLYNPDRHQGPLRRLGPRGSTSFEPATWDEAALIDSATGMCVEKTIDVKNHRGVEQGLISHRVYMLKPNTDVAQYLLNQLIGKPKETQIMEGQVIFKRDF